VLVATSELYCERIIENNPMSLYDELLRFGNDDLKAAWDIFDAGDWIHVALSLQKLIVNALK
jgi:hypothetical protein